MTDKKKPSRGLEEVSHYFLSRPINKGDSKTVAEKNASQAPSLEEETTDQRIHAPTKTRQQEEGVQLKSAYEVDIARIPSSALLRAAKTYLLRGDADKEFVAVDNIASPRFGASDLLLVNKTRTRVVCAKLARGKDCEAFVISGFAFYSWLEKLLQVGAPLLGHRPTLDMVLFFHRFPAAVALMMDQWAQDVRVRPIEYAVFRIESLSHPAVRFRPLRTGRVAKGKAEKQIRQNDVSARPKDQPQPEPVDSARQEWEAFQRLKERAFT
jgi:hypothetical protein